MDWTDVVENAIRLGPDCFIATVTPEGTPHLSVVSPGFLDELIVVATWRSSVKAANLRASRSVMLHWVVREEKNNDMLLLRGEARLVDDPRRSTELWDSKCLPYATGDWYRGPEDPGLLWVEIEPTQASLHRNLGAGGTSTWRPDPPDTSAR